MSGRKILDPTTYVCNIRTTVPIIMLLYICSLLQWTFSPLGWIPQYALHHCHSSRLMTFTCLSLFSENQHAGHQINQCRTTLSFSIWLFMAQLRTVLFFLRTVLPYGLDANTSHLHYKLVHRSSLAATGWMLPRVLSYHLQRNSHWKFFLKSWNFKVWHSISLDPLK